MATCEKIFQKDLYELTFDDLTTFFATPQQENSFLEFKSGDTTLESMHAEVCAFLNTDGGLLIIGAPRETGRGQDKTCTGALTPCTQIPSQDNLMQSIAGNISPSPTGILAKTIELPNGKVYVLDIPQSFNPPHQVNEKGIYYIRLERDAKRAPHGFVEALFNQRRKSDLKVHAHVMAKPGKGKVRLEISIQNEAAVHAEKVGHILELEGIKAISRTNNLPPNTVPLDDHVLTQEVSPTMLVKGMQLIYTIHCTLRLPAVYGRFTYYSNDSGIEHLEFIYDAVNKTFLHGINSKHPFAGKVPELNDPKEWFRYERFRYMAGMLRLNPDKKTDPTIWDHLNEMEDRLDVELPDSLRMLYELVGVSGYTGALGTHALKVFNLSALEEPLDHEPFRNESNYRQIGFIDKYPFYLCIDDPKNVLFLWEESAEEARGQMPSITHCLFDVLEDWVK